MHSCPRSGHRKSNLLAMRQSREKITAVYFRGLLTHGCFSSDRFSEAGRCSGSGRSNGRRNCLRERACTRTVAAIHDYNYNTAGINAAKTTLHRAASPRCSPDRVAHPSGPGYSFTTRSTPQISISRLSLCALSLRCACSALYRSRPSQHQSASPSFE